MQVVYALEDFVNFPTKPSIFLAGPTIRVPEGDSANNCRGWREEALKILQETFLFDGVVFYPEYRDFPPKDLTYSRQVSWELKAREAATVILFWIPRTDLLLGLTTNIEFGEELGKRPIVVGFPNTAKHTEYIAERCSREKIRVHSNLTMLLADAMDKIPVAKGKSITTWFTADTHFGHQRTLEMSKRPFSSITEMDWAIVSNWNEKVKHCDTVYHLGDVGDIFMLKHLNFNRLLLLRGNYDSVSDSDYAKLTGRDIAVIPSGCMFGKENSRFTLVHEPESANDPKAFYLFGHIHKLQMVKRNGLNVGVDCHNFSPIDLDTVMFYSNAIQKYYDENVFIPYMGRKITEEMKCPKD